MPATVGSPAPSFELRDQNREMFSSESLKGKKSLVVFIPFPFTGICDGEACAIRDGLGQLESMDANVVVITTHAINTTSLWAEQNGFEFPILSDYWPHGEVAREYGSLNEKVGAANRSTYVLDADGIVRSVIETEGLSVAREYEEQVAALAAI